MAGDSHQCTETERSHVIDEERLFHDALAGRTEHESLDIHAAFRGKTSPEPAYVADLFGEPGGRALLDLGCGAGEAGVYFATQGAKAVGLDVSPKMCEQAESLAAQHGVGERYSTLCASAEDTGQASSSFDLIYGNGVLHHVDIDAAVAEVNRLLKPGGTAAFIEPLLYNPAIRYYRRLASAVRSPSEHPLTRGDLKRIDAQTHEFQHTEFQLATLSVFAWMYAVERLDPSETRYWKRIVTEGESYGRAFQALERVDSVLLRALPPLRWWCWNTVLVWRKA